MQTDIDYNEEAVTLDDEFGFEKEKAEISAIGAADKLLFDDIQNDELKDDANPIDSIYGVFDMSEPDNFDESDYAEFFGT